MVLSISTNLASLMAQRALARHTEALMGNFRRLSTGLRIATAADDPARLATSERLRASIRSLQAASRNADDGISMLQIAEGALQGVSDNLIRMRELAVSAANGTTSSAERNALAEEFHQLEQEIDRTAHATEFNGTHLLDGSSGGLALQVGLGTSGVDTIFISLAPALSTSLGLASLDISLGSNITAAIAALDGAVNTVASLRGRLAASQNRLDHTRANLAVMAEQKTVAESRIRDVDVAEETAAMARNQVLQQAAVAILVQANLAPQTLLQLLR